MSQDQYNQEGEEVFDYKSPLKQPHNYSDPILMAEYSAVGGVLGSLGGAETTQVGVVCGLVAGYVHGKFDHGNGLGSRQASMIKNLLSNDDEK